MLTGVQLLTFPLHLTLNPLSCHTYSVSLLPRKTRETIKPSVALKQEGNNQLAHWWIAVAGVTFSNGTKKFCHFNPVPKMYLVPSLSRHSSSTISSIATLKDMQHRNHIGKIFIHHNKLWKINIGKMHFMSPPSLRSNKHNLMSLQNTQRRLLIAEKKFERRPCFKINRIFSEALSVDIFLCCNSVLLSKSIGNESTCVIKNCNALVEMGYKQYFTLFPSFPGSPGEPWRPLGPYKRQNKMIQTNCSIVCIVTHENTKLK